MPCSSSTYTPEPPLTKTTQTWHCFGLAASLPSLGSNTPCDTTWHPIALCISSSFCWALKTCGHPPHPSGSSKPHTVHSLCTTLISFLPDYIISHVTSCSPMWIPLYHVLILTVHIKLLPQWKSLWGLCSGHSLDCLSLEYPLTHSDSNIPFRAWYLWHGYYCPQSHFILVDYIFSWREQEMEGQEK